MALEVSIRQQREHLSFGVYPDVGLKDARDKRDEARKLLAAGTDPGVNRKAMKQARADRTANSFEVLAREWHENFRERWSLGHGKRILSGFERDVFPWLGSKPIADISEVELLSSLRRIESRGAVETAHRILSNCGQIFRYAISSGRAKHDPTINLKGALAPVKGTHLAALTEPDKVLIYCAHSMVTKELWSLAVHLSWLLSSLYARVSCDEGC